MTLIPVNPANYNTEPEPMDVGISYTVQIVKCELSPKQDKNGNNYFAVETEVLQPEEYAGVSLSRNYIAVPPPIPPELPDGSNRGVIRKAKNAGVMFSRFCHCFGLRASEDGFDTDTAIGQVGKVIIEQGEYQGRKTFSIKDFLLS